MTVSMRVMSAGTGYQYLLKSVVAGDGNRSLSTPLTRYYTEEGTPPGRWLGSGLHAVADGTLQQDDPVREQQLALLLGLGRDPVSGDPLGRAFPTYGGLTERVAARVSELSAAQSDEERAASVATIEAEEIEAGGKRAVAGYDFTFSVPKSVSVLWGVADAGTQALIVDAHHEAVAEVLDFLEREIATTRRGVNAGDGAVAQADIVGIIATAFDHWDSRLGDPQLHTHVVISNKVKTSQDGRWRSLDGRPLHAAVVALSEHYNAVLADRMTRTFGIEWEQRSRGKDRTPAWELTPVSEDLIREFSSRSRAIDLEKDRLIAQYVAERGRRPSSAEIIRLRARATLTTRPEKQIRSLADLTDEWRGRADLILGTGAAAWAGRIARADVARPALRADDIALDLIEGVGVRVVGVVSEKRSTWRHWNLWSEASRQTMGWRFASSEDREAAVAMIVDAAKSQSLPLTPPELAFSPEEFRRDDDTTLFRSRHSVVFTSAELLAAEDRLLIRSEATDAPVLDLDVLKRLTDTAERVHLLSSVQAEALARIAVSGRQVDLLVGPAGAGKTTAMRALHDAWTSEHGAGSVVGLAPSAAAAQVLADDLGAPCENTAKWLHSHDRGAATFRPGQLVIIDEATLAGTMSLDRLTALATDAGAKVLLVGDWAQLQSVDAGGAFALLASARPDTPELTDVQRFTNEWEKLASLDLRFGRTDVIATYLGHDRVREGATTEMIDAAYAAWRADVGAGMASVLVTDASQSVIELNQRARAERLLDGDTVAGSEVLLADSTQASEGDVVITRRNDRRLHTRRGGWVRNGDRWQVTGVNQDGSLRVQRLGQGSEGEVALPASYVAEHVDLGYAVTAHRAQGLTVDTSHVVVSGSTTRENFYVSMTRGRKSNIAYVALDRPDEGHAPPEPDEVNARTILHGVLQHSGAELSAHQMIEAEQERWSSIAQLAAEYETIAAVAQRRRWVDLLASCGLTDEQVDLVVGSDSFGPLTAELRRADANQPDIGRLVAEVVASRPLDDAEDIGAVLVSRLRKTSRSRLGNRRADAGLIVGLIPLADGPMSTEMKSALTQRQALIESRATALAESVVERNEPWLRRLGPPPTVDAARRAWLHEVTTVAAYRDRYQVSERSTLGAEPRSDAQMLDAVRARRAIQRARAIAEEFAGHSDRSLTVTAEARAIR